MIVPTMTAVTSVLRSTQTTQDGGTLRQRGRRERFTQCGFIFHLMRIAPVASAACSSHGKPRTVATPILPRIATTTITSWGRRTRGATIGIVAASATLAATQLTIAKRPLVIDSVAARCSQRVLRSSWLEKASHRHLQHRLHQLLPRQALRLQLRHQCQHSLHQRRRQHLQRCLTALVCRIQIAAPMHGVLMKRMLAGAQHTLQASAQRPNAW